MSMQQYHKAKACYQKLISKMKSPLCTALITSIVGFYTCQPPQLPVYSSKIVILQLDIQRPEQTYFIRLYDMDSLNLLLQIELYYGFNQNYRILQSNLHAVDYFNGILLFQFRTKEEGQSFLFKVKANSPTIEKFQQLHRKKKTSKIGIIQKIKQHFKTPPKIKPKQKSMKSQIISVKKLNSIEQDKNGTIYNLNKQCDLNELCEIMQGHIGYPKEKQLKSKLQQKKKFTTEEQTNTIKKESFIQKTQQQQNLQKPQYILPPISNLIINKQTNQNSIPIPPPFTTIIHSLENDLTKNITINGGNQAQLLQQIRKKQLKLKATFTKQNNYQSNVTDETQQNQDYAMKLQKKLKIRAQLNSNIDFNIQD